MKQGTRSSTEKFKYNGRTAVRKIYNSKNDSPSDKASRELRFYRRYRHLDIIPELLDTDESTYIVLGFRRGRRHIDLIHEGLTDSQNRAISYAYGSRVAEFFHHADKGALPPTDTADVIANLVRAGREAIQTDRRYDVAELRASLTKVESAAADDAWADPMLGKFDWSSANMLIEDTVLTCLYDFDSSYLGTRLTFLGNIINSCLHLEWRQVRQGLEDHAVVLPSHDLADAAAHFSMWQKALASYRKTRINWPPPREFVSKLRDLSIKVRGPHAGDCFVR